MQRCVVATPLFFFIPLPPSLYVVLMALLSHFYFLEQLDTVVTRAQFNAIV